MVILSQHNQVMPYLIVPRAYDFVEFMKDVFGAVEQIIIPRSEGVIMHGELRIGEAVIMIADTTKEFASKPAGIFIYVNSVDKVYEKAMTLGATSLMTPAKQPYGYTCGFNDPFGNTWWPTETPDE